MTGVHAQPALRRRTRWGIAIIAVELVALSAVKFGILAATVVSAVADTGAPEATAQRSFVSEGWSAGTPTMDATGRLRLVVRDKFGQPVLHPATLTLADGSRDALTPVGEGVLRSGLAYERVPDGAVLEVADGGASPVTTTLRAHAGGAQSSSMPEESTP